MRSFLLCFKEVPFNIFESITIYASNNKSIIIKQIIERAIEVDIFLKTTINISKIKGTRITESIKILICLGTFLLLISPPKHSKNNSQTNSRTASNISSILCLRLIITYFLGNQPSAFQGYSLLLS